MNAVVSAWTRRHVTAAWNVAVDVAAQTTARSVAAAAGGRDG